MDNIVQFRIKDILREKGITSKDLAEKLGKAPQYVSNIINGGKGASLSTLAEIAKTLNVEMRDLFLSEKDTTVSLYGHVEYKGTVYTIKTREDLENLIKKVEQD